MTPLIRTGMYFLPIERMWVIKRYYNVKRMGFEIKGGFGVLREVGVLGFL